MNDVYHKLPGFIHGHLALSLLFVLVLLALVVTECMRLMRKYKSLTPAMLTQLMNRENALVVDLSSINDYKKAHIPGARHVPMSQFDPENKELAKVREMPVILVCKNGQTSSKAAQRLINAGFTRVHMLHNGMAAWRQADLPTAKGAK